MTDSQHDSPRAALGGGRAVVRDVDPDLGVDVRSGRYVAPGGWRRAVLGFAVGLLAGIAVALALPRDDGPRRRRLLEVVPGDVHGDDPAPERRGPTAQG